MSDPENWGEDDENDPDYIEQHLRLHSLRRWRNIGNFGNLHYHNSFSGFTLPLVMNTYTETTMMRNFVENNNVFVLLCANANLDGVFYYGVTMEILETQLKEGTHCTLKLEGWQRCKLRPTEPEITSPLCDTQLLSLKKVDLLLQAIIILKKRLHILKLNTALERLKLEYKFLKLEVMCVRNCDCNASTKFSVNGQSFKAVFVILDGLLCSVEVATITWDGNLQELTWISFVLKIKAHL
ncbi:hypothetical protein NQ317_000579, partial [Molorchus minor]